MGKKANRSSPLSERKLTLWVAIKKVGHRVLEKVSAEIDRSTGLSGADFGILSRLEELGQGKLTQRVLCESLGWHKSRLSHQLTRMASRKLIERSESAETRGVLVSITGSGRKLITAARPVQAQAVRELVLGHLSPSEADVIIEVSKRFMD